ncbi:MAG: hypothetical protein HY652_14485 [Acidobacteria bacterium]|nr:hypothetical protein [Acidobacteriota bacterium]
MVLYKSAPWWVFSFAVILCAGILNAQEPTIQIRVPARDLTVGDPITLSVSVTRPADGEVRWDPRGQISFPLELLGWERSARPLDRKWVEEEHRITVAAFAPGTVPIPPLRFSYRAPGERAKELRSEPGSLRIRSVLPDHPDPWNLPPRDIKPPVSPDASHPWWAWISVGLLVVCSAGFFYRARQEQLLRRKCQPAPQASLEEQLWRELQKARPLLVEGRIKQFHDRAVGLLRGYLQEKFQVMTFEKTSTEILGAFAQRTPNPRQLELLASLLGFSDAVRFDQRLSTPDPNTEFLDKFQEFLLQGGASVLRMHPGVPPS